MTTKHGSLRGSKRHQSVAVKREHIFQIRKSLAEYVDQELDDFGSSLFYQRVYILAKNIGRRDVPLGHRDSLQSTATAATVATVGTMGTMGTVGTVGTAGTAGTTGTTDTATIQTADVAMGNFGGSDRISILETQSGKRSITMILSDDTVPTDALVTVTRLDGDLEKPVKPYEFMAKDNTSLRGSLQTKAVEPVVVEKPRGFFEIFLDKLHELNSICQKKIYTPDTMGGLFLFMGEYTILILEGCEDMIGAFCIELNEIASDYWLINRIFQIEDKLTETYFERLVGRHIPASFINEKFPTSTPNDEYLMSKQHLVIKHKIKTICEMLAADLRIKYEPTEGDETPKKRRFSTTLPLDPYRKLLPEMQRIDLVLNSNRFYSTLESFANIYGTTPLDDEILYWPLPYNYLPPNIFRRTPFDINLTFGDYGMEKDKRSSSVVSNAPDFGLDEVEEGFEDGAAAK